MEKQKGAFTLKWIIYYPSQVKRAMGVDFDVRTGLNFNLEGPKWKNIV